MKGQSAARASPPIGSDEELKERQSLLGEKEAVRGVLFNAVLELVRAEGGTAAVQRCLEASGEKKFLDFFSYPGGKFLEVLYTAARLRGGGGEDFEQALRHLGQQSAENFLVSTAGRTLLVLVQNNPHRLLNSLPWAVQVGIGGVEVSMRRTSPWGGILTVQRDFCPRPFVEGGFLATLRAAGVTNAKVRSWPAGPATTEYELSWQ